MPRYLEQIQRLLMTHRLLHIRIVYTLFLVLCWRVLVKCHLFKDIPAWGYLERDFFLGN